MGLSVVKTQFPSPGAEEVNRDVKKATGGMICQVLDPASAGGLDVVYVNAICLTRRWDWPFKLHDVHEWRMPGSTSSMTFMGKEGRFFYAETASYRYFVLPNATGVMEIFLKRGYDDLPTDLTLDEMQLLRAKRAPVNEGVHARMGLSSGHIVDLMPEGCVTALNRRGNSLRRQSTRRVPGQRNMTK